MTSESNETSSPDPSDSSSVPEPSPAGADAAPTVAMPAVRHASETPPPPAAGPTSPPEAGPTSPPAEAGPTPPSAEAGPPLPPAQASRGRAGQPVYHTSGLYGSRAPQPHRRRRRPLIMSAIAGVVALAVVAAVLVLTVFKPGSGSSTPPPVQGIIPTGKTPPQNAHQVAAAFLAAWQAGNLAKAANYTDNPAAARSALTAYAKDLRLKKFAAAAGGVTEATGSTATAPRESVKFAVSASVAAGSGTSAVRATWPYHSTLVAYQRPKSAVWFVAWRPDVVAPNLTAATHLATVLVPPTVTIVTDTSGRDLTRYKDPGLNTIVGLLKASAPATEGASAGLDVEIVTKAGNPLKNSQAVLVAPGNYPTLGTTISAKAEAAARGAVAMHKQSSMVAIQPSTGHILAIANNAGFNDYALTANVAPGSTMKVITSTALFNDGLTPQSPVACPAAYTVTGITYHNDQNESLPAGTPFTTDFAQSCNNAFSSQWASLSGKLASTAKKYYGLNQKWDIGLGRVAASYFNAPASASGSELAQEAFGEGQLTASPLAMASVAATVDTGTFKQPILRLTTRQLTATRLPARTDADLKTVMRAVVTSGTAAGLGFGPTVYAKTGTADIQGQGQPNSWLIAFDPARDIAVAFLVVDAGYGAQFAGPEAAAFLKAYES